MASANSTFTNKARGSDLSATSSDYEIDNIPSSSAVALGGLIRPKQHSRKNTNKWKPFDLSGTYGGGELDEDEEFTWSTAAEDNGLGDVDSQGHRLQLTSGDGDHYKFTGTEATQHEPTGGTMEAADMLSGISNTTVAEQWPANIGASFRKAIPLGVQHLPKTSGEYVRPETRYMDPPSNQRQVPGTDSNNQHTAIGGGSAPHRPDFTLDMRLGSLDNVIPQDWHSQQRKDSGYAARTTSSRPSFSSERSFLQAGEMPMPPKDSRGSFTFEGRDVQMYGAKEAPRTFGNNPSGHNSRSSGNPEFTFQFPKTQNQGPQWGQQQYGLGEQTTQWPHRPYTHSQEAYIESERKRIAAIIAKSQLSQRRSFPSYGEQQASDRPSPPKQAPARTVLYDPMQSRQGNAQDLITQVSEKPLGTASHSDAALVPFHKTFRPFIPQSQSDKPPRSSGSLGSGNTLRASEPEPGWQDREARIYQGASSYVPQAAAPTALGTDIPSKQAGPTPQNWQGPFFQDDIDSHQRVPSGPNAGLGNMTRKEGRDRWWNSGNAYAAQGTSNLRTTHTTNPVSKAYNTANAPLSLLFQNLSAYTSGPRDYFSRFAAPPEWCIDKSAVGQNSFFGEDWGKAPSRVGRDPRYRPLPVQPEGFFGRAGAPGMGVGADGRRGLRFFAH